MSSTLYVCIFSICIQVSMYSALYIFIIIIINACLQDVKVLQLTPSKLDDTTDLNAKFMCPVTNLPMNGSHRY